MAAQIAPKLLLGTQKAHKHKHFMPGCTYLIGLHYKGVYMGYPYPNVCLCAILMPYFKPMNPGAPEALSPKPSGTRIEPFRNCLRKQAPGGPLQRVPQKDQVSPELRRILQLLPFSPMDLKLCETLNGFRCISTSRHSRLFVSRTTLATADPAPESIA